MDIPLAPVHSGDLRAGIHQVLERWLTRYIPSLGFVLLAIDYDTLHCPTTARILPPTAMALVQGVQFSALGWRPTVGTKLKGRIMHSTRSNISLIVHNTFNAVIDAKHLPMDTYTWDSERVNPVPPYEPLTDDFFKDMFKQEEDEEAATNANGIQEGLSELALQQKQQEETQEQESTIGCWVLQQNQQPVGDGQGMLEFTVVGWVFS